jgi:hypothetical protein
VKLVMLLLQKQHFDNGIAVLLLEKQDNNNIRLCCFSESRILGITTSFWRSRTTGNSLSYRKKKKRIGCYISGNRFFCYAAFLKAAFIRLKNRFGFRRSKINGTSQDFRQILSPDNSHYFNGFLIYPKVNVVGSTNAKSVSCLDMSHRFE